MSFYSNLPDEYSRRSETEGSYDSRYSGNRDLNPSSSIGPVYSPPVDKPPIPAGWVPQWNEQYQRWFYHDTSTGHSQWEAPGYVAPPDRSLFDGGSAYHGYGDGGAYGYSGEKKEKSSGHGGMLLGAGGGLVAGALLSNALDEDDHDEYRSYSQGAPMQAPAYAGSVSSSDRESLEEARKEYAEALDDARSSSASSSDRERLEEAREEYYSEEEEAYGSD